MGYILSGETDGQRTDGETLRASPDPSRALAEKPSAVFLPGNDNVRETIGELKVNLRPKGNQVSQRHE